MFREVGVFFLKKIIVTKTPFICIHDWALLFFVDIPRVYTIILYIR